MSRRSSRATITDVHVEPRADAASTVATRPRTGPNEPWSERHARDFAPPYGQRPMPGPDPFDGTDLIAERIEGARPTGAPMVERRISPAAYMAAAAGLALGAWALVVLVRAGVGRPLGTPIVEVGGFTATAILGLIVLGVGAVLLLAAATRSRVVIATVGLLVTVAATALAVDPTVDEAALAAERDFAIAVAILAGITVLVAVFAADVVRVRPGVPMDAVPQSGPEIP